MWSVPGGWGHYPIQQSAYANIPSEEVDWASLAKQWIAQREVMTSAVPEGPPSVQYVSAPVPPPPPPPPRAPGLDHQQQHLVSANQSSLLTDGCSIHPQSSDMIVADNCNSQDSSDSGFIKHALPRHQPGWDSWSNAGWGIPSWAVPPPPPPDQTSNDGVSEGQFSQTDSFAPAYEYCQKMNEFYDQSFNSGAVAGGFPYWPVSNNQQQVHLPQVMPQSSTCEFRPAPRRGLVGATASVPSLLDDSVLDASKRRQLPAWIREGLEKMERDKQRQMEREKTIRDSQTTKLSHKADSDVNNDAKQSEPLLPPKSRFDSDNEDNSDAETSTVNALPSSDQRGEKNSKSSPETELDVKLLTDEEKQMQIMMRVRQMLTEVLLDVTNREIADIAYSVYKSSKAKQAKAPARQLVKSSALASITSLGLGYDSESDDDSKQGNSTPNRDVSESSDEESVQQRIMQKKIMFEQKMRLLEQHENEETCLHPTLPPKSKFENFSIKQENASDPQSPVTSGADLSRCEEEDSKERNLVTFCAVKLDSDRSLLSGKDDRVNRRKMPKSEGTERYGSCIDSEAVGHCMDSMNHELQPECSKAESSSDSETYEESDESRDRKRMKRVKHKTSQEDLSYVKSRYLKRTSEEFDGKMDSNKLHYENHHEYERAELSGGRLEEQHFSTSPESYSRRRSSHSHDRDSKKWKKGQYKGHRQKRNSDTGFSERLGKDADVYLRHRKRRRSGSTSGSSDGHKRSRRHHRSDDRHHRRLSSSRSTEEHRRGSYGKKSRAKRKSRSLSRSSDDN